MSKPTLPFNDLGAQQRGLRDRIEAAIARVLDHGKYIMGPEVTELESLLSASCGARQTVTCASGTEALLMGLLASEVGAGDAVFVPSFTFAATAETVALAGATPVFVDILPETFNMDPRSLEAAIHTAVQAGLQPSGVIPVDLFGLPADYDAITNIAKSHDLFVIADAAQSFGASANGRRVGTLAGITTTSFFPAKPLGCYGDGGAIFTDDEAIAEMLRSIRLHGKGSDKYDNVRIGLNGRLDTLQAAILIEKLHIFEQEIAARQLIAKRYSEGLAGFAGIPAAPNGITSAWAQYTIVIRDDRRDEIAAKLGEKGIPTAVYYPKPLHRQTAYKDFPAVRGGLPVSDDLAARVLSLPMHPYLEETTQDWIIESTQRALGAAH